MSRLLNVKTIYLDFDGTIHDTMKIYEESLQKGYDYMVSKGYKEPRILAYDEIKSWLGWNVEAMWANFAPNTPEDVRLDAAHIVGKHMEKKLTSGVGSLYKGAEEVLQELNERGYNLIFLSNCVEVYRETVSDIFKIEEYFKRMICSESYDFMPKGDIIKHIRQDFPEAQAFVGDRFHDMEAAYKNKLTSVFCNYGFGHPEEGKDADFKIDDVCELLELFK